MDDEFKDTIKELESEFNSEIKDIEYRFENYDMRIKELELRGVADEKFEIYFYPAVVKYYLLKNINRQRSYSKFYPTFRNEFSEYIDKIKKFSIGGKNLDPQKFCYTKNDDLDQLSKIIANQGRSGFNFLKMVDNIIEINRPVLLLYGVEQLSAFFVNLNFNFTGLNQWEQLIKYKKRRTIRNHGISSGEFNEISFEDSNTLINDLLKKKIYLMELGLCSRFFLIFKGQILDFFYNNRKISFEELLRNFFLGTRGVIDLIDRDLMPIPKEIKEKFKDHFGKDLPKFKLNSSTLIFYLLTFLFAHLSRYKMHAWTELLNSDEKNIGYFIKYFIKYGKTYFLEFLFDRIRYYENGGSIRRAQDIESLF